MDICKFFKNTLAAKDDSCKKEHVNQGCGVRGKMFDSDLYKISNTDSDLAKISNSDSLHEWSLAVKIF